MPLSYVLLLVSGACGLGYQIVWTRWIGFGLGHEMVGVAGVVGAFFLGLAGGAWLLDGRLRRSQRPARWYAGLELVIGLWALAGLVLLPQVDELSAALLGQDPSPWLHAAVALGVPAVGLLPATFAMGGTLPALERLAALRGGGSKLGGLYAANTAGAMAGTLATTFLVLPAFGFRATVVGLAALNFLCAAGGLWLGKREASASGAPEPAAPEDDGDTLGTRRLAVTLFLTGLLGVAYEITGVRMLAQVMENTVFTFALALSVYLAGTALGAALYQAFRRPSGHGRAVGPMLVALSVACLLGVTGMDLARPVHEGIGNEQGLLRAHLSEAAAACLVFLLPTLVMGAAFALLADAWRARGRGFGEALALNTLGSALGPLAAAWLVVPLLGVHWAAIAIGLGYVGLAAGRVGLGALVVGLPLGLAATADLELVQLGEGESVVSQADGVMANVTVTQRAGGARVLRVDNQFRMGGTQAKFLERRQGMIPLLLHPAPERALFLGVGTGATLSAATFHPGLEADGVELVPEVLDALPLFEGVNGGFEDEPSVRLVAADARRFVRASLDAYDVIVADLFQPARDGAGALYTREHFEAVRGALREGGLFCQWLPLYQMDGEVTSIVIATFLEVFPEAHGFVSAFNAETPALGLVGMAGELRVDRAALASRLGEGVLGEELTRLALDDPFDLLGCRIADRAQLLARAATDLRNTDDRPEVMFRAPRFVYGERAKGWGRLEPFLGQEPAPAAELLNDADADFAARVEGYVRARDAFIGGQIALAEERMEGAFAGYVASVEASPDFDAGYHQVLALVNSVPEVPVATRLAAVEAIVRARPELGDLKRLRRELGGDVR